MFASRTQKAIDAQACDWFMLQQERELNQAEQLAFSDWVKASEAHKASYDEFHLVWQGLDVVGRGSEGQALRAEPVTLLDRIKDLFTIESFGLPQMGGACAALLLAALFMLDPSVSEQGEFERYQTAVSETQKQILADGSTVTLGANSQIEVSFSEAKRRVDLIRGQAFFEVSKDPARPFYVATGSATVRVVGTRFDVRRNRDKIKVTVEEGIVEVMRSASTETVTDAEAAVESKRLLAGQQVRVNPQVMGEVVPVETVASWREGRLEYRNARLAEVIADANRYYEGSITLGAAHLENLEVTTSYSVDQVDTMVTMLEQSLPLVVHREAGGRVLILPKF